MSDFSKVEVVINSAKVDMVKEEHGVPVTFYNVENNIPAPFLKEEKEDLSDWRNEVESSPQMFIKSRNPYDQLRSQEQTSKPHIMEENVFDEKEVSNHESGEVELFNECDENEEEKEENIEVELKPITAVDVVPYEGGGDEEELEDLKRHNFGGNEQQVRENCICEEEERNWEVQESNKKGKNEEMGRKYGQIKRKGTSPKVKTVIKCHICKKEFVSSCSLKEHVITHTGKARFKCSVCNKGFFFKSNMYIHMRNHSGETPYKCTVCNKVFTRCSSLKVHTQTHTGVTSYKCTVCNKGFTRCSSLKVHIRIHTGDSPYKCTVCNEGFIRRSTLKVHNMLAHTGESPYRCNTCNKVFTEKSSLVVHFRTHTGETPYKCTVCNKGFTVSSALKVHRRTHTGESPYKCTICYKGFKQSGNLKYHMKLHTGELSRKINA